MQDIQVVIEDSKFDMRACGVSTDYLCLWGFFDRGDKWYKRGYRSSVDT